MAELLGARQNIESVQSLRKLSMRRNEAEPTAQRPQKGEDDEVGLSIHPYLRANWFMHEGSLIGTIYHYDLEFSMWSNAKQEFISKTEKEKTETLSAVLHKVLDERLYKGSETNIDSLMTAHDGRKNLWTPFMLAFTPDDDQNEAEYLEPSSEGNPNHKRIGVSYNEMQWEVRIMPSRGKDTKGKITVDNEKEAVLSQEVIRALEGAVHAFSYNRSEQLQDEPWFFRGTALYPPALRNVAEVKPLGHCKVGVRGWHMSFRNCQRGSALIIDAAFSAFVENGRIDELMAKLMDMKSADELEDKRRREGRPTMDDMRSNMPPLRNVGVQASHFMTYEGRRYTRRFTVQAIDEPPAKSQITYDSGNTVTVQEHFSNMYSISLQHPNLPTVKVAQEKRFPAEVLKVVPGQKKKGITGKQTTQILKFAGKAPSQRIVDTMQINKDTGERIAEALNMDPAINKFGLKMAKEPIAPSARLLPMPCVYFNGDAYVTPSELNFMGEWSADQRPVRRYVDSIINVVNNAPLSNSEISSFTQAVQRLSQQRGMSMDILPERSWVTCKSGDEVTQAIDRATEELRNNDRSGRLSTCVLVITKYNRNTYLDAKLQGDVKSKVVTQVCTQIPLIREAKADYAGNILLKLNAKLGGINHVPRPAEDLPNDDGRHDLSWALNWPCMLIGIDVNYPEAQSQGSSVSAVVGSMDKSGGKFAAAIGKQDKRTDKEIQKTSLRDGVLKLLRSFKERNGETPREMVIFRDGVSEGEFESVNNEVSNIEEAFQDDSLQMTKENQAKPKLTVLTTQKGHHTRLYYLEGEPLGRGNVENVSPGTVVDDDITSSKMWDFYLNSHAPVQGVSKCTHYCVLRDDIGFSQAGIELLSYFECYSYARANRAVSIPGPVYYAHWASKRGGDLLSHGCTETELDAASTYWLGSNQPMWWL
jgi:eukaryotic translation initiation factor 2C